MTPNCHPGKEYSRKPHKNPKRNGLVRPDPQSPSYVSVTDARFGRVSNAHFARVEKNRLHPAIYEHDSCMAQ